MDRLDNPARAPRRRRILGPALILVVLLCVLLGMAAIKYLGPVHALADAVSLADCPHHGGPATGGYVAVTDDGPSRSALPVPKLSPVSAGEACTRTNNGLVLARDGQGHAAGSEPEYLAGGSTVVELGRSGHASTTLRT